MIVEVKFCAYTRTGDKFLCIPESELKADLDSHKDGLLNNHDRHGFIIISSPGMPEVKVQDMLCAIVYNLCFNAIPKLEAGEDIVIPIYDNAGEVRLSQAGSSIQISGDQLPDVAFDKMSLMSSLYECGNRFLEFAEKMMPYDAEYTDFLEAVKGPAEMAGAALGKNK